MSSSSLKQFRIRDLHDGSSQQQQSSRGGDQAQDIVDTAERHDISDLSSRHAVVQVSESDYDDIASNHPRALLTYIDEEDDGEVITVGSSIELSQRLSEPIDLKSQLEQNNYNHPMHIFDIRRSNSVTELWKRYQYQPETVIYPGSDGEVKEASSNSERLISDHAQPDGSQSLLEAFEAEMAKIMEASERQKKMPVQPDEPSSSGVGPGITTDSDKTPNPADIFAHTLQSVMEGAGLIYSELGSKIPELDQRLHDAQRVVPEHVGTGLQVAFSALESQAKNFASALNNASAALGQRAAERDSRGDNPTAEDSVDGLRNMASEIGQMGRTLFDAFSAGFRQDTATHRDQNDKEEDVPNASTSEKEEEYGTGDEHPADCTVSGVESSRPPNDSPENEQETPNRRIDNSPTEPFEGISVDFSKPAGPSSNRDEKTRHFDSTPLRHHPLRASRRFMPHRHPAHHNPIHLPPHPPVSHPFRSNPIPTPPPFWKPPHNFPSPVPFHPLTPSIATGHHWQAGHPFSTPAYRDAKENSSEIPKGNQAPQDAVELDQPVDRTLFIGNVGFNVTERMVRDVFASKGFLVNVDLPLDLETGRHAGFGYLHFASVYAAKAALEAFQGVHIDGHAINLEFSDRSPISRITTSQDATDDAKSPTPNMQTSSNRRDPVVNSREPKLVWRQQFTDIHGTMQEPQDLKAIFNGESSSKSDMDLAQESGSTTDAVDPSSSSQSKSPTILDEGDEDPEFSARYPSLVPEAGKKPRKTGVPDRLPHLSPELEMKRFPPVSQFEAHLLANQREASRATSSNASSHRPQPTSKTDSTEARKSSTSQEEHSVRGERPTSFAENRRVFEQELPRYQRPIGTHLRRSNTTIHTNPSARLSAPFDPFSPSDSQTAYRTLRRRATEHHALRSAAHNGWRGFRHCETGGQDANSTEEQWRSVSTDQQSPSVELPVRNAPLVDSNDTVHADPKQQAIINNCVATLLSLGYGSPQDGGRQRIAVYAAAANGKVLDAIDMIEEERKAYEQRE